MKLTMTMFVTLDGVIQGPGSPDEDRSGGFTRGGWVAPFADDDLGDYVNEQFGKAESFLFGRNTFEVFAGYWPSKVDPNDRIAHGFNTKDKFVVSRTIRSPEWGPTTVIADDVANAIAELKQRPGGELQVHGSAQLVRALHTYDLIDLYRILRFPVVLGDGQRVFPLKGLATAMRLVGGMTTGSGIVVSEYEPTGRVAFGSADDLAIYDHYNES